MEAKSKEKPKAPSLELVALEGVPNCNDVAVVFGGKCIVATQNGQFSV